MMSFIQEFKPVAEFLTYVTAVVFFICKLASGYHYANMAIDVSSERVPLDSGEDALIVTVRFKKGATGSLRIYDAQVRVAYGDGPEPVIKPLLGYRRLGMTKKPFQIDWRGKPEGRQRYLRLPPNDETQFACSFTVPPTALCSIEVAVLTHEHWWWGYGQWLASAMSPPKTKDMNLG